MSRPLNPTEKSQIRAMIARTSYQTVLSTIAPSILGALDNAATQMAQCEKMFRDDAEFMEALNDVRAELEKE